jgi:hypothetical protein
MLGLLVEAPRGKDMVDYVIAFESNPSTEPFMGRHILKIGGGTTASW